MQAIWFFVGTHIYVGCLDTSRDLSIDRLDEATKKNVGDNRW